MELRHLKYFDAVARTLSFSKAAEELHIAQPPLSRQIQQLEEEIGVQLIDRSSRPIQLTNAGQFFHEQTIQIMAKMRELKSATKRIGQAERKWIGIGFVPSILYGFLPKLLRDFGLENPNLDVSISELTSVQQAEALITGRIDIGFGRLAIPDESLDNHILLEEKLVAAIPTPSALAEQEIVSLSQLMEETLVLYPVSPRPSFADQVLRQFSVRGYTVSKLYETNGLQTAIGLVAAGMGVTVVPESVQRFSRPEIAYRPIRESGLTTPLVMTTRRNDNSAHLIAFKEMIAKHLAQPA
jgi:DNA-binding transcriptional LysR family regulator